MKKTCVIFSFFVLFSSKFIFGQDVVSIVPDDPNYNNTFSPSTPGCTWQGLTFKVQVKNSAGVITNTGLNSCEANWTIFPGSQLTPTLPGGGNGQSTNVTTINSTILTGVKFENLNTSGIITANLVSRPSQTCPYAGQTYNISKPIRYLGPVSAITGTNSIGCLATSLNLSVPIVVNATSYEWLFQQSGWTTSSTSNSATISVPAGTLGSGIYVVAKRNDNICTRTSDQIGSNGTYDPFLVTRPTPASTPIINGTNPAIVCGSNTVNLTTSSGASGYSWVSSNGNITIASGQGTSSIQASSSLDGLSGNIKVAFTNTCGAGPFSSNRDIYRGVASFTGKYVNGGASQSINMINNPAVLSVSAPAASSINWNVATGSGAVYPSGFSASAYAYPFTTIKAQTNNQCGLGEQYFFYLQQNGSSLMRVGPNPAKNTLAVNFVAGLPDELLPDNITLFDGDKKAHFSNDAKKILKGKDEKDKTVNIDTSTLPRGNYYLHVTNSNYSEKDKQVEKIKIILE